MRIGAIETMVKGRRIDLSLWLLVSALCLVGLGVLYSASDANQAVYLGQVFRMGVGILVMLVCAHIPLRRWRQWAPVAFWWMVALLLAVLLLGYVGKGAQRWLAIGGMKVQPSEFFKLVLPWYLADVLANQVRPLSWRASASMSWRIGLPFILTAKQPDLGSALLLAGAGFSVVWLSGLRKRWIVLALVSLMIAAPLAWKHLHGYQKARIVSFLDPSSDPHGSGYHVLQAKIAVGSGGVWGKGWLSGTQSRFAFLPEHQTDFVFAVLAEEFGLLGSSALLLLYVLLLWRMGSIVWGATEPFSQLWAGGIWSVVALSVMMNLGMVVGLLPVVGVPLPLMSYGGSSMITLFASFGILMGIRCERHWVAQT